MSFCRIDNVAIAGIAACVPKERTKVTDLGVFSTEEASKFSESTGIYELRITLPETTTADLAFQAATRLLSDLSWDKNEIDVLIFVTQTPDYILPATSCTLQHRLNLREDVLVLDISLGCSGWIYGLMTISSFLSAGTFKKGLLLVGDTISKICSKEDKSTYPLFGDAGTATALEFHPSCPSMFFNWGVDGSSSNAIIILDGGFRNQFSGKSLETSEFEGGIHRAPKDLILEGMDVFSFGITKAPQSVNALLEYYKIENERVDHFVFHQANLFMNEKIRKKLKIPPEKVPYSLREFGNTSSATIPLTMVTKLGKETFSKVKSILACGFGVGLSWGSVFFTADRLVCSDLVEI